MRVAETLVRLARCQSGLSMIEFALVLAMSAAVASVIMRAGDLAAMLSEMLKAAS
jgi:hypothetical protein